MKLLDVGSGSGKTILTIAEKVKPDGKAVGVDFSPEAVALAKGNAKKSGLDQVTEFHLAPATTLPFEDDCFDIVTSECVVCLIPDKQKALNEKVRVLKPGGRVIMHDVIAKSPMPRIMKESEGLYCGCVGGAVSVEENIAIMKKAGLVNIETVDFTWQTGKASNRAILEQAMEMKDDGDFREIVDFVRRGGVGYMLFEGTKPSRH